MISYINYVLDLNKTLYEIKDGVKADSTIFLNVNEIKK